MHPTKEEIRAARGELSQAEAAKRAGVSVQAWASYEAGRIKPRPNRWPAVLLTLLEPRDIAPAAPVPSSPAPHLAPEGFIVAKDGRAGAILRTVMRLYNMDKAADAVEMLANLAFEPGARSSAAWVEEELAKTRQADRSAKEAGELFQ